MTSATETLGQRAERHVHERLLNALSADYVLLQNVTWIVRSRGGFEREGEADLVIAHPDKGFLTVEVKGGPIARDSQGRWWAGNRQLDRPPFEQAADSHHSLVAKLRELPDWPADLDPIAGHAVAFPNVELESLGTKVFDLGMSADPDLILDKAILDPEGPRNQRIRDWVDGCFELWSGGAKRAPGKKGVELLQATVTSPLELRTLLRSEIADGNREMVRATDEQLFLLNTLRGVRRAAVVGGAGTGKTMLAMAKARQLASEGFETLLVCFNSPLARVLADETRDVAERTGHLHVSTFHQLCEDLAREADTLPPKPEPGHGRVVRRRAGDRARCRDRDARPSLPCDRGRRGPGLRERLARVARGPPLRWEGGRPLRLPRSGAGGLPCRPDRGAGADRIPPRLQLPQRPADPRRSSSRWPRAACHRSPAARTAGRSSSSPPTTTRNTIEALRKVLHQLVETEGVAPGSIAVISGLGLEHSAVWKHRQYGNQVLWNGAVDDAGRSLGLAAADVPEQPPDVVLCESIRRFKGLERPVIVLLELPRDDPDRLDRLLYIGASRARQHLVVIAPVAVLGRLESSSRR